MHTTTSQEKIAANVREALEEQNHSRQELAAQIGVTYQQACKLIKGDSRIRFDHLSKIGAWLKIDPRKFLGLPVADDDTWLTIRECSATVKRHPDTIRKAVSAGELDSTQRKRQGMHLIKKSDLDAWIAGVR
ncbi:Helix-turn-helix [Brevibacterium sp. 239c]|uniref:helix-turn-helix domain-containing protein n=1 Tax=Brevibacterium sp. 239c TaxID=1965356 RepID=UPI000C373B01|nr:helix-turn-helix domain-containing protein [Brevibacterium sp. 239c]SMY01407.1 Helix-turn-helix [Brevibacterium sp. 239c]